MDTMLMNPVSVSGVGSSISTVHMQTAATERETAVAAQPKESLPAQQSAHESERSLDETRKILHESTQKFNEMSESLNLDIKFAYNDKIEQVYLNVIEKNTGRVIRKLPSEEAMKISESMKELIGTLLDKKG